jgi:hypothetical protein
MFNGWSRGTIALLASPLGLLVISATRLLVISNYNTTTAAAIASSGGYLNTVLGTLIPLVPLFLPYLALLFILFRKLVLSLLTFIAAIFVSPTKLAPLTSLASLTSLHVLKGYWNGFEHFTAHHVEQIAIIAFALFVVGLIAYNEKVDPVLRQEATIAVLRAGQPIQELAKKLEIGEKELRNWVSGGKAIDFTSIVLAALATAILLPYISYVYPVPRIFVYYENLLRQPWIPPENITLGSGSVVVGYPLSISDGWMTILVAQSRIIEYVPAGDVHGRFVCQIGSERQSTTVASALISLSRTKAAQIPSCGSSSSAGSLASTSSLQNTRWTAQATTISNTSFTPVVSLSHLRICTLNQLTATLSVELNGSPAGFRILMDRRIVMHPGRVRFDPAGVHDSFSFTFETEVKSFRGKDLHAISVEWRSPFGQPVTLERGTIVLNYQSGSYNC